MTNNTNSPTPFIKDEPEDFRQYDLNGFMPTSSSHLHSQGQDHMSAGFDMGSSGGIDPSAINTNSGGMLQPSFGSQLNMSSSYIDDDELADLITSPGPAHGMQGGFHQRKMHHQIPSLGGQNSPFTNMYSNTPDGAPIQSPFMHSFNYGQWQPLPQNQQSGFGQQQPRSSFHGSDRMNAMGKSPMTPMTPGMHALHLGSPEPGSLTSQPIQASLNSHSHNRNGSSQWDNTPISRHSTFDLDSPLSSPGLGMNHPPISEVLSSSKHGSVSVKSETGGHHRTIEAKRQKRRESHNAVERRRRNNINDRIQELSRLVPAHRLEDDAIRRYIQNNAALPASLAGASLSQSANGSLLSTSNGRRGCVGTITQGLPIEDKDKGPAKGEVLNGSVGWTRDLMWLVNILLKNESMLQSKVQELGGHVTLEQTEDEQRMRSEVSHALAKNNVESFEYTRGNEKGLWVPGFTDPTGAPLQSNRPNGEGSGGQLGSSLSPEDKLWEYNDFDQAQDPINLKEEDEINMDLG